MVAWRYRYASWKSTRLKMDKETRKQIWNEIEASTIPEEIKALYLLADAVETMNTQVFERIKRVYVRHGFKLSENELLTGINEYCRSVKKASFLFYQKVEPQITGATFDIGGVEHYDNFNGWANELCRLNLLYLDRCAGDPDTFAKTFAMLRKRKSGGLIKDEDVSKYKMKK